MVRLVFFKEKLQVIDAVLKSLVCQDKIINFSKYQSASVNTQNFFNTCISVLIRLSQRFKEISLPQMHRGQELMQSNVWTTLRYANRKKRSRVTLTIGKFRFLLTRYDLTLNNMELILLSKKVHICSYFLAISKPDQHFKLANQSLLSKTWLSIWMKSQNCRTQVCSDYNNLAICFDFHKKKTQFMDFW